MRKIKNGKNAKQSETTMICILQGILFIHINIWGTYSMFTPLSACSITSSLGLETKKCAFASAFSKVHVVHVGDEVPTENEPDKQLQSW